MWFPISKLVQSAVNPLVKALEILGAKSLPILVAPKSAICGCPLIAVYPKLCKSHCKLAKSN